ALPFGPGPARVCDWMDVETADAGPSSEVIARARAGDRSAQDELLRAVQDRIYGLALRMLGDPDDAQDAVQEILLRIIRHIDGFRGDSAFTTWVYRIAANQLLTHRMQRASRMTTNLDDMAAWLDAGLGRAPSSAPKDPVLIEE